MTQISLIDNWSNQLREFTLRHFGCWRCELKDKKTKPVYEYKWKCQQDHITGQGRVRKYGTMNRHTQTSSNDRNSWSLCDASAALATMKKSSQISFMWCRKCVSNKEFWEKRKEVITANVFQINFIKMNDGCQGKQGWNEWNVRIFTFSRESRKWVYSRFENTIFPECPQIASYRAVKKAASCTNSNFDSPCRHVIYMRAYIGTTQ